MTMFPGATNGWRKVRRQRLHRLDMRSNLACVDLGDAALVHTEVRGNLVVHIPFAASAFHYRDFDFCEWLSLHVDNSVAMTKPSLTARPRSETTPCTSVAVPCGPEAKRLGFQMLAASSLKRGGPGSPPQLHQSSEIRA